jgi:hypothetical protein
MAGKEQKDLERYLGFQASLDWIHSSRRGGGETCRRGDTKDTRIGTSTSPSGVMQSVLEVSRACGELIPR